MPVNIKHGHTINYIITQIVLLIGVSRKVTNITIIILLKFKFYPICSFVRLFLCSSVKKCSINFKKIYEFNYTEISSFYLLMISWSMYCKPY